MALAAWSVTFLLIGFALIFVASGEPVLSFVGWATVILALLVAVVAVLFEGRDTPGGGRVD